MFIIFTFGSLIGWNGFTYFNLYDEYDQESYQYAHGLNTMSGKLQEKVPHFQNVLQVSAEFEDSSNVLSSDSRSLFNDITSQSSGFPPTNSDSETSSGFPPTNSDSETSSGFPHTSEDRTSSHSQGIFSGEVGQQQSCTAFTMDDGPCNLEMICPSGCILQQPIIINSKKPVNGIEYMIVPKGSEITTDGGLKMEEIEAESVGSYMVLNKK